MSNTLIILRKRASLLEAQQIASKEFVRFFNEWHDYITRMTGVPVRERYAAEGMKTWLIRVEVEAQEEKMNEIKRWAAEHIRPDHDQGFARDVPMWNA